MARTTLLKGGKCRLLGGELISLHPLLPHEFLPRFHEIVSNPFVLFHCSLLVVSLSICGRRAKLRQLSPTLTAGPFPPFFDIILYIYNVCATRVNLISRDSSQFARHTASNFAWDSSPGVAPYFLSKRPCALPIMTSPGWVLLKILTLDPPDTTRPLSLSFSLAPRKESIFSLASRWVNIPPPR